MTKIIPAILVMLAVLSTNNSNAQLVINEVSAANYDDYIVGGDNEDWFEIYNTGGTAIDIQDYYISDDILNPTLYQVPVSITVPANGYVVVFASGRNSIVGGNIHTNFKITQAKQEYAVLSNPGGAIIDSWWLENSNQKNHSFGRVSDGDGTWGIFTNPTPGGPNTGSFAGYAPTPIFSQAAGNYSGSVDVGIEGEGLEIRYTLDGSIPDQTSALYASPITISNTTVLRARCFSSDPTILPSFMETNTYFIDVSHTVNVLSVAGNEIIPFLNATAGGGQFQGSMEYFDETLTLVDEGIGDYNEHGNDSWAYAQRGFDFIMRDQFGYNNGLYDQIYVNKDRAEFQRIIVKAAANDNYPFSGGGGGAHIRDAYCHELSQRAGLKLDERTNEPCIVYLNGQYWGVYEMREKVDDLDFTCYYYDQCQGQVDFIKTWGGTWSEYGNGEPDWDDLVTFITTNDMTDDANYQYVKGELSTGSLIDYFILNSYVVAADWLNWNTAWWRGKDPDGDHKKWGYILWDLDNTFGYGTNYTGVPSQDPDADPCNPETLGNPGGQGHVPMLNALFTNEEFYQDYVSRYADLSAGPLSCESMHAVLDEMIARIAPEMPGQISRWGGNIATWETNVQSIHNFIDTRCQVIADGIVDCYDVEGPFEVTVIIQPPLAGEVNFNTINITESPWVGTYFGGLDVDLEATPNGTNLFSFWSSNNHDLDDPNSPNTFFAFEQGDTIVANFVTTTTDLTLDVQPPGAGDIDFLLTNYTDFPTIVETPELANLDITTSPLGNFFEFDHWEITAGTLTNGDQADATINIENPTSLTAFYNELENYNITIDSEGLDGTVGGEITLNGEVIDDFPFSEQYLANIEYFLTAEAPENYHFLYWVVGNTILSTDPSISSTSFILTGDDVIIAVFAENENYTLTLMVDPPQAGDLYLNGSKVLAPPYSKKYYVGNFDISLNAEAREFHEFTDWKSAHHDFGDDVNKTNLNFVLTETDTVIANFYAEPFGFWLPNAFSPNEDGVNDIFRAQGSSVDVDEFEMLVFDRIGNLVFETQDITDGWNGDGYTDDKYYSSEGLYSYLVTVKSAIDGSFHEYTGYITIVR